MGDSAVLARFARTPLQNGQFWSNLMNDVFRFARTSLRVILCGHIFPPSAYETLTGLTCEGDQGSEPIVPPYCQKYRCTSGLSKKLKIVKKIRGVHYLQVGAE